MFLFRWEMVLLKADCGLLPPCLEGGKWGMLLGVKSPIKRIFNSSTSGPAFTF